MAVSMDFLAGAFGGCAGVLAGHPLDTVKIQIQTQHHGGRYKSLMDVFKTVGGQKLSKGFFRGMSGPFLSYGYLSAIFFGCYGGVLNMLDHVDKPFTKPKYSIIAVASVIATVPQVICSCPIEVTKVVLQSQIPQMQGNAPSGKLFKGPLETAVTILKRDGIRGLYRGFCAQLARDLPSASVYLTCFRGSQYNGRKLFPSLPTQVINFVGGGLSGVLCWTVVLPLDVVKSRLQADLQKTRYSGLWDCAKKVYVSEGTSAFFAGFIPMSVRAFIVNSVILMVYAESLEILKRLNNDHE